MTQQLTIKDRLSGESFKEEIAKALPKHLTPERFIRVALTALNRTPKLQKCTQVSLFKCLLDCSSLGIEPDDRLAYLIPYGTKCTLIVSYLGLIELCKRNGSVAIVYACLVRVGDAIEIEQGSDRGIKHKPRLTDSGDVIGAYAIVQFKDGSEDFEWMSIEAIEKIRERSQAKDSGPWVTDPGEMQKKTVIRRLMKRQTLSPEIHDQIAREDGYESSSFAERVANAKPADTNAFELPEENPLEKTEEEHGTMVVELGNTPVNELELTPAEQDKAEYEEGLARESEGSE